MNYLIVTNKYEPFYTNWFDADNDFNKELGMIVFNLLSHKYTTDGKTWYDIFQDHL
jgi:hypothetical protein